MKNHKQVRIITIIICLLALILCFQNFKNATSKIVFLIGAIVWSIAGIMNIIRFVISNKKNIAE